MPTRKDLVKQEAISFKSVGEKIEAYQQRQSQTKTPQQPRPIGIRTPLALGSTRLFETHTDMATQIKDNLRNLILTQMLLMKKVGIVINQHIQLNVGLKSKNIK